MRGPKCLYAQIYSYSQLNVNGMKPRISIILPVFDEEERIKRCIERLLSYFKGSGWDFELIFVVDKSQDNTSSILNEYRLKEKNVEILNPPVHLGKGGCIMYAALTYAYTSKDYVAFMDSDLAADPSELERLLEYAEDYDIVIGSRILRGELDPIKRPLYRSFLSHLYSKLFRTLFRMPIHDPQCGFKLFKKEIIPKIFKDIAVTGFAFDTDLIVTAFSQRLQIKEVPINWVHEKFSKLDILFEIQKMGIDLFSIWYHFHLLWQQRKTCYPQKKGSIYGRILFASLSLSNKIKERSLNPIFSELLNPKLTNASPSIKI
jgi:dolichyl-phosphate beta-glucosyltransferase